jgi:hypothetical protein
VGTDDDGRAAPVRLEHLPQQRPSCRGIDGRKRLIEQQESRLVDEGAREQHASRLAV